MARVGDYEKEVRAMCYANKQSPTDIGFTKLIFYADECYRRATETTRSKCKAGAMKVKNTFTMWIAKYKTDPEFAGEFRKILQHANKKKTENKIQFP